MKTISVKVFAIVALLNFPFNITLTQRCQKEKISADLSSYRAVFSGQVIDTRSGIKFKVERIWKGELLREITIAFDSTVGQQKNSSRTLNFQKGESYLVYALGDTTTEQLEHQVVYGSNLNVVHYITNCTKTKKLVDAKEDLKVLGEGLAVDSFTDDNFTEPTERFDVPIVKEDIHAIDFPVNYKVTIEAQGPAEYTVVIFGSLSRTVSSLDKLERLAPKHPLVVVGLKNGERAGFITPNGNEMSDRSPRDMDEAEDMDEITNGRFEFWIQATRVQKKPFTLLRDEGEIEDGTLHAVLNATGEATSAELSGLARGFKVLITWSRIVDETRQQNGGRRP
jgi:hypothetical protein